MIELQVIELLDRLYQVLDNLAIQHQLFKVETIGCTHMVVGNLQTPHPGHASTAAWFAMDAHKAAQRILICEEDPSLGWAVLSCHLTPLLAFSIVTIWALTAHDCLYDHALHRQLTKGIVR